MVNVLGILKCHMHNKNVIIPSAFQTREVVKIKYKVLEILQTKISHFFWRLVYISLATD